MIPDADGNIVETEIERNRYGSTVSVQTVDKDSFSAIR